jgi:hypothetical protein
MTQFQLRFTNCLVKTEPAAEPSSIQAVSHVKCSSFSVPKVLVTNSEQNIDFLKVRPRLSYKFGQSKS